MASSGYNEAAQQALREALLDIGKKLLKPPSAVDELLILLEKAAVLLSDVYQRSPRPTEEALVPAMRALIADEILKHADLNIQVAVASCANELTRISAPTFPYSDDHMKEVFRLIMVAFKQLACGSGINYLKAMRILATVALVRSCLIMLDIDIDPMVVEMFQLFLDTIKSNNCSDMFDHMKTIMSLIIEESDDISMELLTPLLSSVKMENKNTSPRSWELGKTVFENCATKLQNRVRDAVKSMNLSIDHYAEIVGSLCQDPPIEKDEVVANEEVSSVLCVTAGASGDGVSNLEGTSQAEQEDCPPQVNDESGDILTDENSSETLKCSQQIVQLKSDNTRSHMEVQNNEEIAESKMDIQVHQSDNTRSHMEVKNNEEIAESKTDIQVHRRRRGRKPNTLMRPEEGYQHAWLAGGSGHFRASYYGISNEENDSLLPSDTGNAKIPSDSSQKEIDSVKEVSTSKRGQSQKQGSMVNQDIAQELPSKPGKNILQNEVKEKGTDKPEKMTEGVIIGSGSVGIEKEQVNHDSGDVADKVEECSMSKPAKAKQSKVKKTGSNTGKKTTKRVVAGSCKVAAEKELVNDSAEDSEGKDENGITSQKYESADVADKVVESPMSEPAKAEFPGDLEPGMEKEPMDFRLEYGPELVNLRIMVWWPLDQTYYTGTVESFDPLTKKHKIKYDDDEEEVLDMSEERWELFNEKQPRQILSSCKWEADHPSPAKGSIKTQKKTRRRKACSLKKQHAGSSSKRSRSEGRSLIKSGHSADFAPKPFPINDESDDEMPGANLSSKKQHVGSSSKRSKSEGHSLVKFGRSTHSAHDSLLSSDEFDDEMRGANFSSQKQHGASSSKRSKSKGRSLIKFEHSAHSARESVLVSDESDDEMRGANLSSKKQHVGPSSTRSRTGGHSLVNSGHLADFESDPLPVNDESDEEMCGANLSSKKQHAGSSSKRSKGEGRSLVRHSAHSSLESFPNNDDSDDEMGGANLSSKKQHARSSSKKSKSKGRSLTNSARGAHSARDSVPISDESADEMCGANLSSKKHHVISLSKRSRSGGRSLIKSGHSALELVKDESDDEMRVVNLSSKKQRGASSSKKSKSEGCRLIKTGRVVHFARESVLDESDDELRGTNLSSEKQCVGSSSQRSRIKGHSLIKSGHSASDSIPGNDESDDEMRGTNLSSKKQLAGSSFKRSRIEGRSLIKSGHSTPQSIPGNDESDDEMRGANLSSKKRLAGSSFKRPRREGRTLVTSGRSVYSAQAPVLVNYQSDEKMRGANLSSKKQRAGSSFKRSKSEGRSLVKSRCSAHSVQYSVVVNDELDDDMRRANLSSKKQQTGSLSKKSKNEGHNLVKSVHFAHSPPESASVTDESDDEMCGVNSLSKKQHAGSSSKRSKSEGRRIVKSGHSQCESIPVKGELDDETHEANFSLKDEGKNRARKKESKTLNKKGKPSSGTFQGAKNG